MREHLKPIKDRLIVVVDEAPDTTEGGIVVPDQAKEKPVRGVVQAAGPETKYVKDGSKILFSRYAGSEINLGKETFLILREDDILTTIEEID
jgi:chaperonin GroES